MKELFRILGDKLAAPLWEIERHVKLMANSAETINRGIDCVSDALYEQSRTQARELEEIKHTLQAISEKD